MTPIEQVAVVVPVHDEAELLPGCLQSIAAAAATISVPVVVVAVLDGCHDDSASVVDTFPAVSTVQIDARNVGAARAAGFGHARSLVRSPEARVWYASTDADSMVDPDWLDRQLAWHADMALGVVRVDAWRHYPSTVADRYARDYQLGVSGGGHGHVHGANLGCRADHYWRLGGFHELATDEDVDLVDRFLADGREVVWDAESSVRTSDRPVGRAPHGFAEHLAQLADEAAGP